MNSSLESSNWYFTGETHLGHNHNLVAWEAQLFDGFSENDFGKSIRIDLIIPPNGKQIKKESVETNIGCIKSVDSRIITFFLKNLIIKPLWLEKNRLYLRCLDVLDRFFLW